MHSRMRPPRFVAVITNLFPRHVLHTVSYTSVAFLSEHVSISSIVCSHLLSPNVLFPFNGRGGARW